MTTRLLRPAERGLVYTKIWNFMSSYGKKRGGTYRKPGHTGYPGGCPFIFDPEFAEFCDRHARQLAATKDDPWLLGHFTLGLLESRVCVGWHWFRYSDNDPTQKGADPSNLDANKGIVTSRYKPYQVLLDAMRDVNVRTFGLIRHFDDRGR